jgi:VanZ family protein
VEDVAGRRFAWALAALYCLAIFLLSSRTPQRLPASPFAHADKLVHAVEYAVLGGLLARALGGRGLGWTGCLLAVALAATYGASDEWHQSFVPGRDSSIADLVADTIGAGVGIVLVARRPGAGKD